MKNFFKALFSDSGEVSAKRFGGLIGWGVFCLILSASIALSHDISPQQLDLVDTLAYTSVFLITGGTIETILTRKQKVQ